ncbi:MAG: GNAT family N-acetyltransferase [Acidimicrobiales bacterium]|nr:GNAT family N-acetyltransferase [Acidimicrobiales bacterium]
MQAIELDAGRRFADIGMPETAAAPPPTAAELIEPIESGRAWVAEDSDGTVVGFAVAAIVDRQAHLSQVSVPVAGGGRGVGRALVDAVVEWGHSAGCEWLTLTTFRDVAFNGPWYTRLGFAALPDDEQGPQLQAIRATEIDAGLDAEAPRFAMRRAINPAHF